MPHFIGFSSIALFVAFAQARNDTLVTGWVPEPNGRGTWSILWSSLATIFICTWSVLHLSVRKQGRWRSFLRKSKYMLVVVLAPESILTLSFEDFYHARQYLSAFVRYGGSEWTMVHAQFALDDGFEVSSTDGEIKPCTADEIIKLMGKGKISRPSISEEELQSRSDSNGLLKLIALLQILWFALQTLFRAIQHIQITPLELLVIAFVFCSMLTYILYWSKPQNVEYPILLPQRVQTSHDTTAALTPSQTTIELPADLAFKAVMIMIAFSMTLFGAIHCLAWNSSFPSRAEQLTWRICALITTSIPAFIGAVSMCLSSNDVEDFFDKIDHGYGRKLGSSCILGLYAVPRLALIVLAFTTLRAQPSDTYQTINWTRYLPNFAA